LLTAPLIQSTIDERFEITGDFTQEAVEDMVAILRSGTLPARLQREPTSVKKVDP
jgi:preprotein translocase subunit SecD